MMQSIVLVVHVVLCLGVIGLVLIQHGKGADAGAAFGSGASATVFGAQGAASFLTRVTTYAALAFFLTSLVLFYMAAHRDTSGGSVLDNVEVPALESGVEDQAAPAATDAADVPAAPVSADQNSDLPAAPKAE
ncbi:preprotein translocase subunit SecG [Granulosicoccaceae sp. 1_MG-2023]|nr:preprotein translocase subunit SecG [Granulosicoccaceae sp. 1_MG-2023]